jgi:lipopolysaccharide biosynthesis glycosyltransferase
MRQCEVSKPELVTGDCCVATACDTGYFPALMALLRSLKRTNPGLPVVVFDGGLTPKQVRRAASFAEILPREPFDSIESRGKFSYINCTTLLKFEVITLPFDTVLYLDVDMVVTEDLTPLFHIPKGFVGGVPEMNSVRNMFRLQHRDMLAEALNIDWKRRGMNGGLFVLRPAEWQDMTCHARRLIDKFGKDVFSKSMDQQLLNIIFDGKIHSLPARYNFSPLYDDIDEGMPAVIHYLSECKPWHLDYPLGRQYEIFRSNIRLMDFPEIVLLDIRRFFKGIRK